MVGLLASRLINAVGWQSLFYIGGILRLGLSIVLIPALPDSIEFLVMRGAARRDIRDLVIRICPAVDIASGCQFVINDERTRGVPVSQLFSAGRAWVGQLFHQLFDLGDQRSLDTEVAAKSRNQWRPIIGRHSAVRIGQCVRNAARRVSGESVRCDNRARSICVAHCAERHGAANQ
jgi:hypothetical protein